MFYDLARSTVLVICFFGIVSAQQSVDVWLDVPFVKQVKKGCGSASIAMVMQYWLEQQGRLVTESADADQIHAALFEPDADGIYASAMERYFQEHGFRAFSFRGDLEMVQQHLQKGRPLIVALKPSASDNTLHYVVVVGIDKVQDHVLLNDPAQRKLLRHSRSDFEKQWNATGEWTLLAVP
ncbi:MAG TPA: C39 family peptidase [Pyrinomonadaceae bacterium]|nr:C39 family peptidase [Pyrinomonadaceae bacterium]HMP64813.1 C39 family peptidase [Pyrinomonadaceae bacterium]